MIGFAAEVITCREISNCVVVSASPHGLRANLLSRKGVRVSNIETPMTSLQIISSGVWISESVASLTKQRDLAKTELSVTHRKSFHLMGISLNGQRWQTYLLNKGIMTSFIYLEALHVFCSIQVHSSRSIGNVSYRCLFVLHGS